MSQLKIVYQKKKKIVAGTGTRQATFKIYNLNTCLVLSIISKKTIFFKYKRSFNYDLF